LRKAEAEAVSFKTKAVSIKVPRRHARALLRHSGQSVDAATMTILQVSSIYILYFTIYKKATNQTNIERFGQ
jgi:hypothetical protein